LDQKSNLLTEWAEPQSLSTPCFYVISATQPEQPYSLKKRSVFHSFMDDAASSMELSLERASGVIAESKKGFS
jgi:hypothetical protein